MILGENIRFLRKKKGLSQEEFARIIIVNRGSVGHYETGNSLPKPETLIKIADYFNVSIDSLLREDLSTLKILSKPKGKNLFVPIDAQAGYLNSVDQSYIDQQKHFADIFGLQGETRTYRIAGDSMYPILNHGDYVVCREIESLSNIKKRVIYIVINHSYEIVAKYVDRKEKGLNLISENSDFKDILISNEDVKEVWEVILKITDNLLHPRYYTKETSLSKLLKKLEEVIKQKGG